MNRIFYGYIIVIAAFFIMMAYAASRFTFGIFFDPLINEFAWSAALLSGAYSLSIVVDGTVGILMGRLTDKLGPRKILTICGLLAGLGFILLSRITTVWQMYLIYGLLIGIGMSGVFVPVISIIPRWFIAKRNTVNGIVLAGMGLGNLAIAPLAYWIISSYAGKLPIS
jgi:MFS family permease